MKTFPGRCQDGYWCEIKGAFYTREGVGRWNRARFKGIILWFCKRNDIFFYCSILYLFLLYKRNIMLIFAKN